MSKLIQFKNKMNKRGGVSLLFKEYFSKSTCLFLKGINVRIVIKINMYKYI